MARGRFDSEYERVRAKSALGRRLPEFPDDDPDVDRQHLAERVAASHAEFKEQMTKLNAHEIEQRARTKAAADATTARSNAIVMMREYQQRGITPPFTKPDGSPQYSLAFLLRMGWTIERIGEYATLIKPERFR